MASSLTYGSLRQLARLYRVGIDGAAEALAMLIEEHADELPDLLGFPMANLDRLRTHDDPVGVLVATIEGAPRVARSLRERMHYDGAASLALQLAETAEPREDGHLALDVALLAQTLRLYPGRVVTFGERGSLGSLRLRAVLRELRGVMATSVVVTREHVVVAYDSARSRGLIRLALHPPVIDHQSLIVPIGSAAEATAEPTTAALPGVVIREDPRVVLHERIDRPRGVGHIALRFIEALAAAALGGAP